MPVLRRAGPARRGGRVGAWAGKSKEKNEAGLGVCFFALCMAQWQWVAPRHPEILE